jgi:hypothetical protein
MLEQYWNKTEVIGSDCIAHLGSAIKAISANPIKRNDSQGKNRLRPL